MIDPADILGAHGPFAAELPGFRPREAQRRMARAVADAIESRRVLVCEAGTGIGKTFAYLVPALLAGRRVLVSTGTRHLQDQIQQHDLPTVRRAIGSPASVAVLKGRSNYLCPQRFEQLLVQGRLSDRAEVKELAALRAWAPTTASGDLAEVTALAEDSGLLPRVTSTSDNCLGSRCPRLSECFVAKARRKAQEADVVVVNHHLLLADMVLKEEGFGALLPDFDAVIVDEAHQLPDLAAQAFGTSFAARQASGLVDDARSELGATALEGEFKAALGAVDPALKHARLALGAAIGRGPWGEQVVRAEVRDAIHELQATLSRIAAALAAVGTEPASALRGRAAALAAALEPFSAVEAMAEATAEEGDVVPGAAGRVLWYETFKQSFVLNATPLDPAARFRAQLDAKPAAWVFTSATLAVGEDFELFTKRLGLLEPETLALASPFDYERNALLYLPPDLPAPDDPGHTRAVVEAALPLIAASRGRAFMLFTSHRALKAAAALLAGKLPHPLLVQGDMPRARLLERFRQAGDAVLLGTASFWEGVDVKGPTLSLVVIDKLPFASPGDPVMAARIESLRQLGGSPFTELQLPQAVLALKQGVGRLIRDHDDTGVMAICDPRLKRRGYGRSFIAALPPMRGTEDQDEALRFLRERTGLAEALA
jgi:ATP-dependent DNA helicase DinG